jgi:hypothetical protein
MKRLALLALLVTLAALFFASSTPGEDGDGRVPGSWPKPAERCTTANRGTLKWVRDQQNEVWIKWACRCNIGKITVCKWTLLIVSKYLYLRVQRPDGSWYIPAGWHKHPHFVKLPMVWSWGGGFCTHFWTTWHYVPARLR